MDDISFFAKGDGQLDQDLDRAKTFSNDIKMDFELDKCTKATIKWGKIVSGTTGRVNDDAKISKLDRSDVYKYLGIDKSDSIHHIKIKAKICKEYYHRIRDILNTELKKKSK